MAKSLCFDPPGVMANPEDVMEEHRKHLRLCIEHEDMEIQNAMSRRSQYIAKLKEYDFAVGALRTAFPKDEDER